MDAKSRGISPIWVAAVATAAAAALLWRASVEPLDFRYVRYLGIADEMVRSGDWVVLRLVDRIYLDKPPLFLWLIAAPLAWLHPVPGWVPHLPDLLALALSLVCIHRLGAAIYGRGEPAIAAALVFATTWETFQQVTSKRLDLLFAALLTAAFTTFYLGARGREDGRPRAAVLAASWVFVGLATLTKGPLALLFFVLVAGGWAAWTGRLRCLGSRGSLAGLAVFVVLSLAWPALLVHRLGMDATLEALSETSLTTRTGDILLYARSLPVLDLPWSLFLPALAVGLWRRRSVRSHEGLRFLLLWFLGIVVLLHLPEARHQRYLEPVTPALVLLLLSLWYEPEGGRVQPQPAVARLRDGASALCLGLLAVAGLVAGPGLLLLARDPVGGEPLPAERLLAAPLLIVVAAGAAFALRRFSRDSRARSSPVPLALLFLGVLTSFNLLAGGVLRDGDAVPVARAALAPVAAGQPGALLGLDEKQIQMARLLTQRPIPRLQTAEEVAGWLRVQPPGTAVVVTDAAGRRALAALPGRTIRELGSFVLAQETVEALALPSGP